MERLEPALCHAEAVFLNGMGEPLPHPDLPRMIALTKARQPKGGWCGVQNNGLLLDKPCARERVCAGLDLACLSVDGNPLGSDHRREHGLGHGPGQVRVVAEGVAL